MEESKKVSIYRQKYVLEVFEAFNNKHRHVVNDTFDISITPFLLDDLLKFIGTGQPSLLHLAKFIYNKIQAAVREKHGDPALAHNEGGLDDKEQIHAITTKFNNLNSDSIIDQFLDPTKNPDIHNPFIPQDTDVPELLQLSPKSLVERLSELHLGCRITLNLRGLTAADVLEILYCCRGAISHLEIYSLKDHIAGTSFYSSEINTLQLAINHGNVIVLKKMIRKMLDDPDIDGASEGESGSRKKKLTEILHNLSALQDFYKNSALKSRIGSDSTGRSRHHFGMGLVIKDTLPNRVQKQLANDSAHEHMDVPVYIPAHQRIIYLPSTLGEATLDILSYGRPKMTSGFSVPLLDLFMKTLVMENLFGVTTETNPIALYSFMALANGIYISGHNLFRGLPKETVYGNFFRSILSIPLALFFNTVIGGLLGIAGITEVQSILQKWAAVISKLASDCIAGVIEGIGDRLNNMRNREVDYVTKIKQMFDIYASLEILLPEENVLELLDTPKLFLQTIAEKRPELGDIMIINALDMLYFWMYQPRGAGTLTTIMKSMTREERRILVASLKVLQQQKRISQLFINGVLGKKFSKGLAFYLDQSQDYLKTISSLA